MSVRRRDWNWTLVWGIAFGAVAMVVACILGVVLYIVFPISIVPIFVAAIGAGIVGSFAGWLVRGPGLVRGCVFAWVVIVLLSATYLALWVPRTGFLGDPRAWHLFFYGPSLLVAPFGFAVGVQLVRRSPSEPLFREPDPVDLTCPRCNYDVRGIDSKICPECGGPIRRAEQWPHRPAFPASAKGPESGERGQAS